MIRKSIYILVLGFLFSATVANACDGPKATKASKIKKATATCTKGSCMKNGKCTMTAAAMKSGACDMSAKSGACNMSAAKSGTCNMSATNHSTCSMKTGAIHASCGMKSASATVAAAPAVEAVPTVKN